MKKLLCICTAILLMLFAFTGCGGSDSKGTESGGKSEVETTAPIGEAKTAGNIKVLVPDGWKLTPGSAGGIEDDNSLFLTPEDRLMDYVWVQITDKGTIDNSLGMNNEKDIEPITINGIKWQGKKNQIYAEINGDYWLISQYNCDFNDEIVQAIIASVEHI